MSISHGSQVRILNTMRPFGFQRWFHAADELDGSACQVGFSAIV